MSLEAIVPLSSLQTYLLSSTYSSSCCEMLFRLFLASLIRFSLLRTLASLPVVKSASSR